ncbi:MAG: hypothetical protein HYS74_02185 [Parcubacteria group bacterium]|nr:hypothetical protein [Parcubacteria group bacterium]
MPHGKFFPSNRLLEQLFSARDNLARSKEELDELAKLANGRGIILPRIVRDGGFLPGLIRERGIEMVPANEFFERREAHFAARR